MVSPTSIISLILLVFQISISPTTPAPLPETGSIDVADAQPNFKAGDFTMKQKAQINIAFQDAAVLARKAAQAEILNLPGGLYHRYFRQQDYETVKKVFLAVIDGDELKLSPKLAALTVALDFKGPGGKFFCDGDDVDAFLLGRNTDNPTLILCAPAFKFGSIGPVAPGAPPQVNLYNLGDRTTSRMATLGSILLHEFLHWEKLVMPPLSQPILGGVDKDHPKGIYGVVEVQDRKNIDAGLTLHLADAYTWFATDVYWTYRRGEEEFEPAKPGDDKSPVCGNQVCVDVSSQ